MEWISRRKGELNAGLTRSKLKKVVDSIPQSVADAYTAILNKSTDETRARRLLHTILVAKRALTLAEMNIAMSAKPYMTSEADLDLESEENLKGTVRSLCGLFVNIIDERVYLIHQTAKEFLLSDTNSSFEVPRGPWVHSFALEQSHLVLANICMTYLLFVEFKYAWPKGFGKDSFIIYRSGTRRNDQGIDKEDNFLLYAIGSWISHIDEICAQDKNSLNVARRFCDTDGFFDAWIGLCKDVGHLCRTCLSPLILAFSHGAAKCVNIFLSRRLWLSSTCSPGCTAFNFAAKSSHGCFIRLLMYYGADPDISYLIGEKLWIELSRKDTTRASSATRQIERQHEKDV